MSLSACYRPLSLDVTRRCGKLKDWVRQRTDAMIRLRSNATGLLAKEINMIIGGGLLGTILVIALIVYLLRRA